MKVITKLPQVCAYETWSRWALMFPLDDVLGGKCARVQNVNIGVKIVAGYLHTTAIARLAPSPTHSVKMA